MLLKKIILVFRYGYHNYLDTSTIINLKFSNTDLDFLFRFVVATDLPKLMICHTCQKTISSVFRFFFK